MAAFFEKLANAVGGRKKPATYEEQRASLENANAKERLKIAKSKDTHKEVLYYLAQQDPDPKVRKAVAQNSSLPVQASPILAKDDDQDVRLILAKRLVDLLPDLSTDKHSQIYAFAVQALGTLALDEVLKIRLALSSTLKDHAYTPPKVAGQLARDVERQVSEPILRYCAALSDEDLLDILKSHSASWVVEAVAARERVSEEISDAVIETNSRPGGKILISNEGANIAPATLQTIVEKSKSYPEWQKPVAARKNLPIDLAKDLANFADDSVRDLLMNRSDFDAETIEEISKVFKRRMSFMSEQEHDGKSPVERAQALFKAKKLDESAISDAIAAREKDFVIAALALLTKAKLADIERIFATKTPKAIVAVCWRAGLSMRMAFQMQKDMVNVPHKELLYPKDGTDYPLNEEDLEWQLDFLGIKKK